MSETPTRLISQAKPVMAISMPTRFSGSRAQANRPVLTQPQPTSSPSTATAPRSGEVIAREDEREVDQPQRHGSAPEPPQGTAEGDQRSASRAAPDSSDFGMKPRT